MAKLYKLGKKKHLKTAKHNATLLPFGVLFQLKNTEKTHNCTNLPPLTVVERGHSMATYDESSSVAFRVPGKERAGEYIYLTANDLLPLKNK